MGKRPMHFAFFYMKSRVFFFLKKIEVSLVYGG